MSEPTLPSYENAPIVEVVAAVSFEPLPPSSLVHFGVLWKDKFAQAFPRVEVKAPYAAPIERFGPEIFAPQIQFSVEEDFPLPRLWFLNHEGDEVLQLQRNWFACNWRKVGESRYTRWPTRRAALLRWYGALNDYVREVGLGELVPTQCEVTYINHVTPGGSWKTHGEISKIFRGIGESQLPVMMEREGTRFGQDLLMRTDDGQPTGRLHVTAQPAFKSDDRAPIYIVELTARGIPTEASTDGVLGFLDRGRNAIVSTFAAIISDEMQREWGVSA